MRILARITKTCGGALVALTMATSAAIAVPTSFIDLGVIGGPGVYTFTTDGSLNISPNAGSATDTELGLWDMSGNLLAADDDSSSGDWSQIAIALNGGMYFLGISEAMSDFADNFLNNGDAWEPGDQSIVSLNINASAAIATAINGDQLDQETAFFKVTVAAAAVSAPAAFPLLGLGFAVLGLLRWRRTRTVAA